MTKIINLTRFRITVTQSNGQKTVFHPHETPSYVRETAVYREHPLDGQIPITGIDVDTWHPQEYFKADEETIFIVSAEVALVATEIASRNFIYPFEAIVDDEELTNPDMEVFKFGFIS